MTDGFDKSLEKMRAEGMPDVAVDTFAHYYRQLAEGGAGTIAESDIEPAANIPSFDDLPEDRGAARETLDKVVMIKLNGGLGTGMGMTGPKSLLAVKDDASFLDVIARQVLGLRERYGARLPLVLMNSFHTRDKSLAALERYPELHTDVPIDFGQGRVPKLRSDSLEPVDWPADPSMEWAPPGHGDIYTALVASGMLAELIGKGYEYAFISNSDNLGAVLEPRILAWFAATELPFVMEVAERTEADRKGGHIAWRKDGGLVLRELAQTAEPDLDAFQDVQRHSFFNTNTLWVNLHALSAVLDEREGVLGLPMIVNRKTVDPADKGSPEVIQLETAMGAAVDVFEGAAALRVPRNRLVPVKTTSDLLGLRSDAYVLTGESRVEMAPARKGRPLFVDLDPDHFKLLGDFEERFPAGPPSLVACDRLVVKGDVTFGRDVVVRGTARIENDREEQLSVGDGTVIDDQG